MDDEQNSGVMLFLIGENHREDKNDHDNVLNFCVKRIIIFANESPRFDDKENPHPISNGFGDLICDLYSVVGSLYLSFSVNNSTVYGELDRQHDLKSFGITLKNISDSYYKENMEPVYDKKYNQDKIFELLTDKMSFVLSDMNKENLFKLLEYLRKIILSNPAFEDAELIILNLENFKKTVRQNEEQFRRLLETELRDRGFITNLQDLINNAIKFGKKEIIAPLGRNHLETIRPLLPTLNSAIVVESANYTDFYKNWKTWNNIFEPHQKNVSAQTQNNPTQFDQNSFFYKKKIKECDHHEYEDAVNYLTRKY